MSRRLARTLALSSALAVMVLMAATSPVDAYGNAAQWQAGFSGTCSSTASFCPFLPPGVTGVRTGFWGWCEFGGSDGSSVVGTTGTTADCQITTYFGATTGQPTNPIHITYDINGWRIQSGSPFVPPGVPDFLLTSGAFELSGPGAAANPFGFPVGVPISIPSPCPPVICDTGIPAVPGHFSFHPTPGVELNVQVNKLP
jgi:hypothetical protein